MMHMFGPVPWFEIALTLAGLALAVWCIRGFVRRRFAPREGTGAALVWIVAALLLLAMAAPVLVLVHLLREGGW